MISPEASPMKFRDATERKKEAANRKGNGASRWWKKKKKKKFRPSNGYQLPGATAERKRSRKRALLSFSSTRVIRQTRVPPNHPPPPDGLDVVALKLTAIYPSLSLPLRGRHNGRAADNVTMLTGRIYSDAPTLSLFPLLPLLLFLSLPLPTT